jgi:phospholipid/cholesterol/gamma-HCH transport system ATP-binding protein
MPADSTHADCCINFRDVFLRFDENEVLKGITFNVPRGETKVLIGVAGTGKSTILKLALGLLKPDSGNIHMLGEDVTAMSEPELFQLRRRVGMVFQESALFDSQSVRNNVAFRLIEEHVPPAEIDARVHEVLSFVELEHTMDKFPSQLSGGMRRRVAIARAIITHPEVILYDSPTGGLDPMTSTTIDELIVKQRDLSQTTALMVTHRLQDAFLMANHFYNPESRRLEAMPKGTVNETTSFLMLKDGKVVFDGDVRALAASRDEYIREYIA